MARRLRVKMPGSGVLYHVVSRVRGRDFLLDAEMKRHFHGLLARLKTLYFVGYAAYAILDNHYHLLLDFDDPAEVDPKEALDRWNAYHADSPYTRNHSVASHREYVVKELTDLSSFMKRLNTQMTFRHNRLTGSSGTLWEARFRSSLVERGQAALVCAAYIDLNPFRASLVRRPEAYKFASMYALARGNVDGLLDLRLLAEGTGIPASEPKQLYGVYRAFVYLAGSRPAGRGKRRIEVTAGMLKRLARQELDLERGLLHRRCAIWVDSVVIGGLALAREVYARWIDPGLRGRRREEHASRWMYSPLRNLWTLCSAAVRGSPRTGEP